MNLDTGKIDDAYLALLMLGATGNRAWKGLDSDTMRRLHERGFISDPNDRGYTVVFSDEGLTRARRLLAEMFTRDASPPASSD